MDPDRVRLQFFGQTYYLAGGQDLAEVVGYVEELAEGLQSKHPDLPVNRLVVLLVLELAQQCLELRRGFMGYRAGVEEEARRLVERIDKILDS